MERPSFFSIFVRQIESNENPGILQETHARYFGAYRFVEAALLSLFGTQPFHRGNAILALVKASGLELLLQTPDDSCL
ncbi:hypothetical protein SAMN05444412_101505 [Rhodonellum ikkaensis]|uniref:Fido domain-containing protein n=1 Tax=Rhodonellum ikkaensis TaxID=336829 RepID=A0A1H3KSK9_9BACT|nr:hypothetical protein SAMN05444412_101505 [Rhodonellum ikkaensis]